MASKLLSEDSLSVVDHLDDVEKRVTASARPSSKAALQDKFAGLDSEATLIVIADPLLRPLSLLLETSLWEASLCPIQVTDMRNFAHGRHSWLHHRAERDCYLGIDGARFTYSMANDQRRNAFNHTGFDL